MTDKNSFETVELFEPMSLMQIDGSNPFDVKDEAKAVQEPAKADGRVAENSVAVRGNTGVNPDTNVNHNREANHNTDTNYNTDSKTHSDYSVEKILLDPRELIGNNQDFDDDQDFDDTPDSGEKQDYQKHNYAARFVIICLVVLCILFALITAKSFMDSDQRAVAESNYNPILVSQGEDVSSSTYTGGAGFNNVPVYTEMDFNTDQIDSEMPAIINHRCVEFTNSYNRIVFFTATTTQDDVGLMINVEMFDRHGHSLGASANSNSDVPIGNEFMIPVYFSISPEQDLSGVTYKINAETFKDREEALRRTITDVTEAEKGHFFITCEGTAYSSVAPYITLYKNGKVVGILSGYGDFDETGKAVIEVSNPDVDYDTYKVFY